MIEIEFVWGRDLERRTKVVCWKVVPRVGEYVDVGVDHKLKVDRVTYEKNGAVQVYLDYWSYA